MPRFDRYLLSQLLQLFGFFSLVLVLVYWINRAVGLFDRLIGDGQSAMVFVELSLLTLPNVIRIVLPVSAFAATVYVANRLTQDGELVVMQATGFSAFRLVRPVLWFGLIVAAMMLVLMHFIVPASRAALTERTAEIGANVTARLLVDGQFMHPTDGVTFYIRELTDRGELLDIFLSDERTETSRIAYTARRAVLVRDGDRPKLVMFEGMSQSHDRRTGRLSVTHFADFTYDLGDVLTPGTDGSRSIDEMSTLELLRPSPENLQETGATRAVFLSEGHQRFSQPLLAPAAAMIGFATLLLGAFSRFGLWRQIIGAILLLIVVQMVGNAATAASVQGGIRWPLVYIAPALGVALSLLILWVAQRPRRRHAAGPGPLSPERSAT
ncbi:LPS export ABC transporter permease LptF [Szabonella alba]|uniref:LPS export ABC transporter permease LptF n=1 Tax=Szabonella alba TaxID=2804194 RepID=A0A8K0VDF0_9RHOB|nr:LPS export ABC transporter permease LptF [Szabonella alba]MBL4917095.1 LPS export ABC transporter permease LptF [Szabonella alba]